MDLFEAWSPRFGLFLLVFTRVSGLVATAPVLGNRAVPGGVKASLSALLALLLLPAVSLPPDGLPSTTLALALAVARELGLGLALGFLASLVFLAVQLAGELMDMQFGFSMVNVIDPQFGIQVPLIGNFLYLLAILILLLTDGHHLLVWGLHRSFVLAPPGAFAITGNSTAVAVDSFSGLFAVAISLAAPVVGVLLLTSVALGILSRTLPQMNVFLVGMPLKLIVGLLVFPLTLPLFAVLLEQIFGRMVAYMLSFLQTLVV